MNEGKISLDPIGTIHTDYETAEDMPIQGSMDPDSSGIVSLDADYRAGLKDLEAFSHLILIYYFHESDGKHDLEVEPFLENEYHGVFATRAPRRPNPVGMTSVKLDSMNDQTLIVRSIDVLDGTPLLDIKPYVPEIDAHSDADDGWIAGRMSSIHHSDDRFT